MLNYLRPQAAGLAALVLLAGCADLRLGPNGKAGWVTEIYTAEQLRNARPSCLSGLSKAQIAGHRYAEITVPHLRSYRYVSAQIPDALTLHLHDRVEIAPATCTENTIPQVIQVLKSAS